MKKIIRFTATILCSLLFVTAINAQTTKLASDMPAQPADKVKPIAEVKDATVKTPAPPVNVVSAKAADNNIKATAPVKTEVKLPLVSDQGGVTPSDVESKSSIPAQNAKPVEQPKLPLVSTQEAKKTGKD